MEGFLVRVYKSKKIKLSLKIISHAAVLISVIAYALLVYLAAREDIWDAVRLIAASGVPFLTVTALRRLIDAPRPYELYDFYEIKPKGKAGRSFPSRHVFSAFMISTLAFPVSISLGIALMLLAAALATARVALGIHFIRDVAAGALIGILSGLLALLI